MVAKEKNGELKSKTVAKDMAGDVAVAKKESPPVVANSKSSPQSEKKNTARTNVLSREQSLQIIRDCVSMVGKDGVATQIGGFTSKSGKPCVLIVLENVSLKDGDFVWAE